MIGVACGGSILAWNRESHKTRREPVVVDRGRARAHHRASGNVAVPTGRCLAKGDVIPSTASTEMRSAKAIRPPPEPSICPFAPHGWFASRWTIRMGCSCCDARQHAHMAPTLSEHPDFRLQDRKKTHRPYGQSQQKPLDNRHPRAKARFRARVAQG